jgi:hypothetical protein
MKGEREMIMQIKSTGEKVTVLTDEVLRNEGNWLTVRKEDGSIHQYRSRELQYVEKTEEGEEYAVFADNNENDLYRATRWMANKERVIQIGRSAAEARKGFNGHVEVKSKSDCQTIWRSSVWYNGHIIEKEWNK